MIASCITIDLVTSCLEWDMQVNEADWFANGVFQSSAVGLYIGGCTDGPVKKALTLLKRLLDLAPEDQAVVGDLAYFELF